MSGAPATASPALLLSAVPERVFRARVGEVLDRLGLRPEALTCVVPAIYQDAYPFLGEVVPWPTPRYDPALAGELLGARRVGTLAVLYAGSAARHANVFATARRLRPARLVAIEAESLRVLSPRGAPLAALRFLLGELRAALRESLPRLALAALRLAWLPLRAARAARRALFPREPLPCRLCDARCAQHLYDFDPDTAIWRCAACGFAAPVPRPSEEALHAHFHAYGAYRDPEVVRRSYAETPVPRHEAIAAAARQGRALRVLEIGAGSGAWVHNLKRRFPDWEILGQDVDPVNAALARERSGVEILVGRVPELGLPADHFDFVVASQVLEHVPAEELGPLVAAVSKALRPGGSFVGDVPNFDSLPHRLLERRWKNVHPLDHGSMLTARSLRALLERAGAFSRVEVRVSPVVDVAQMLGNALGVRDPRVPAGAHWRLAVDGGDGAELSFVATR